MEPGSVTRELLIVAGEASGDLHGARMLSELLSLSPDTHAFGLGGKELKAAGMELLADSAEISVVGITEVMRVLPRAKEIFRQILQEVERRGVQEAVLIDFPDFNLRLAKELKKRHVRVVYYISPQVWAWRKRRVNSIKRLVDRMLVILPFELGFYARHGVEATYVGHPLVDEVPELTPRWENNAPQGGPLQITLLPGSRHSEIRSNLPVMLAAGELLDQGHDCQFRLIQAGTVGDEALGEVLSSSTLEVRIVKGDRFAAIADSHLAICASGTATLEVGLLGTPMVVVYRISPWSYFLGRLLVRLPHIALVNLVLEQRVVPELIQSDATAEGIFGEASAILAQSDRIRTMMRDLAQLRPRLGEHGASRRAAERILAEIGRGAGS